MYQNIEDLREQNRNRLIGLALAHLQLEAIASAVISIPGGDRVIAIGTPAQVRELLGADGVSIDAVSDDHLWQIAIVVNRLAGGSLWNVSEYDCVTAIRASFMDPDAGREYEKARAAALEGGHHD